MATLTLDNTYVTYKVVFDDDLGSTAVQNITNGSATVYSIFVDNTGNNSDVSVLKLYDNLVDGGIVANSTEVDYQFTIAGGTRRLLSFASGLPISNGLSMRCITGGALANTSDPTSNVTVSVVYG